MNQKSLYTQKRKKRSQDKGDIRVAHPPLKQLKTFKGMDVTLLGLFNLVDIFESISRLSECICFVKCIRVDIDGCSISKNLAFWLNMRLRLCIFNY